MGFGPQDGDAKQAAFDQGQDIVDETGGHRTAAHHHDVLADVERDPCPHPASAEGDGVLPVSRLQPGPGLSRVLAPASTRRKTGRRDGGAWS